MGITGGISTMEKDSPLTICMYLAYSVATTHAPGKSDIQQERKSIKMSKTPIGLFTWMQRDHVSWAMYP